MWKRLALIPIAMLCSFSASASMQEYQALEKQALAGDYQAQRNVAYWLTGGNGGEPPLNPVLGCAWRMVILSSGARSVDASDVSNKQLYCDKRLDANGRRAAEAQAEKLLKEIKKPSRR